MMHQLFSEDDIKRYLQKKGYHIAQMPAHYLNRVGPEEKDQETKVTVAITQKDYEAIRELYWLEDIDRQYGLRAVFNKELARKLLSL
jgi:hypothetical protein